jgi:DNA-binding response OmpR family regulator
MPEIVRILIADDDANYSNVLKRYLSREGFVCDCVPDGETAIAMLGEADYSLLISDIEMPGNTDLELIRRLSTVAPDVPVILVTAYPTVGTALESMQLPVFVYLLKPIEFPELLNHVRNGIARYKISKSVRASEARVSDWMNNLVELNGAIQTYSSGSVDLGMRSYLSLTFSNMISGMQELKGLLDIAFSNNSNARTCQLGQCPLKREFTEAMERAIEALRETKSAVKSKEIADLRRNFERMLEDARRDFGPTNS